MYKKICFLLIVMMVLPVVSPYHIATTTLGHQKKNVDYSNEQNYRNTIQTADRYVLAELGSTSWCPNCPRADVAMKTLYESSSLPFYYMTLVYDLNDAASKRGRQLADSYIPMLYIDGGYLVVDSVSQTNYANAIEDAIERASKDVSLTMEAEWTQNNSIQISLDITNHGSRSYICNARICVLEINSRWTDEDGINYSYALMDYALTTYAIVRDVTSVSVNWDNNIDLSEGNTMILAYVAHWLPHLQKNPWTEPKPFRFLAQFVDNVCVVEL